MLILFFYRRVFYIDFLMILFIKVIYLMNNRIEILENYDILNLIFLYFD